MPSLFSTNIALVGHDSTPLVPVMLHSATPIAPAPVPTGFYPHMELPWQQIGLPIFNKYTVTVVHSFQFILLDGHDVGWLIPHLCAPPSLTWIPIVNVFSARSMLFVAGTVKFDGTGVASAAPVPIPLPMMTCMDPISLPNSLCLASVTTTVKVGISLADLGVALISFLGSVALDLLFTPFKGFKISSAGTSLFDAVSERVLKYVGPILKRLGGTLVDRGLNVTSRIVGRVTRTGDIGGAYITVAVMNRLRDGGRRILQRVDDVLIEGEKEVIDEFIRKGFFGDAPIAKAVVGSTVKDPLVAAGQNYVDGGDRGVQSVVKLGKMGGELEIASYSWVDAPPAAEPAANEPTDAEKREKALNAARRMWGGSLQ